jgi:hypothetical protein
MTSKYLYLTQIQWSENWINGGHIPISLASRYKNDIRSGILTPDENQIHESNVDLNSLNPMIIFGDSFNCKSLKIKNLNINGRIFTNEKSAKLYKEDGLILSFCNIENEEIAKRLVKKACVKINNIEELKSSFDLQIGCEGIMKECEYTSSHERNHFLKSNLDEWQNEFRIFWKSNNEKELEVPKGIAELIRIY